MQYPPGQEQIDQLLEIRPPFAGFFSFGGNTNNLAVFSSK
jgi:hypothetical protein